MTGLCQEHWCARRRGGGRVADRSTRGIFHVHSEFVPVQTCYDNYKAPQAFARWALPPTRQSARKSMTQTSQEIRVLVVDDSPVSRKLLEHALAEAPYTLGFANEGSHALRLFGERLPDLVIADWQLPDISGPELCRIVRKQFASAYTYVSCLWATPTKRALPKGWLPAR